MAREIEKTIGELRIRQQELRLKITDKVAAHDSYVDHVARINEIELVMATLLKFAKGIEDED